MPPNQTLRVTASLPSDRSVSASGRFNYQPPTRLIVSDIYWKKGNEIVRFIPVNKVVTLYIKTKCPANPENFLKFTLKTYRDNGNQFIEEEITINGLPAVSRDKTGPPYYLFKYENFCYHLGYKYP